MSLSTKLIHCDSACLSFAPFVTFYIYIYMFIHEHVYILLIVLCLYITFVYIGIHVVTGEGKITPNRPIYMAVSISLQFVAVRW